MKRTGSVMVLVSIVLPLVLYFGMTTSPSDLDSWYDDADEGDGTMVLARIESEEEADEDHYYYEIKGSDTKLISKSDVANKGDYVLLDIEKGNGGLIIESKYSVYLFAFPLAILFILGSILYFRGSRAERAARDGTPLDPLMRFCTACGFVMKYVEEYGRWYCFQCGKYEQMIYEGVPVVLDAPIVERVRCPSCGSVMTIEGGSGDPVECLECGATGIIP